ncbi:MAG: polysaccharide deacetylase family protein [Saprospiraceae bacterium]|nr:MAG: polysaccharide deacetylase family protein [Bacteroidetes bacterium OLB9]MCO6464313.1 polysaccharide deacetylase family protein [Saprospiraceae bacterium]MCZ2338291.1 polysaccharide deacetylase family protein [Chitinophagales bacterium]
MLNTLIHLTGQRVIFPFYHVVSNQKIPHISPLYRVKTVEAFKKDLEYLLRFYQPMDLKDVMDFLASGKQQSKPGFFLTFDDGLRPIFDVVRPILLEYGIPAAFFINPDFVDNKSMFFRYKAAILMDKLQPYSSIQTTALVNTLQIKDIKGFLLGIGYKQRHQLSKIAEIMEVDFAQYLKEVQPYMTLQEIRQLCQDGFYIGGHSLNHPLYSDINIEEQLSQTQASLTYIHHHIQSDYRIFAFPFTEYGVQAAFFKSAEADIFFGTAGLKNDPEPRLLHRIPMEIKGQSAQKILQSQYLYYAAKSLVGKNTIRR